MTEIHRLRRAGGGVLRLLVDLIPVDLTSDRSRADQDEETCLVFADVADYSEFVAHAGDNAAIQVLDVLDDVVTDAMRAAEDARVVKRLGDGLMIAASSSPEALRIAVDLVDGFAERSAGIGMPLALRAGVHRGTCRRYGQDYFGYHVNLAARLAAASDPGETLSTAHALAGVDLPGVGIQATPAGLLEAKGVNGPLPVFALERAAAGDGEPGGGRNRTRNPLLWPLRQLPGVGERRFRTG